jgi:hypothetical protein
VVTEKKGFFSITDLKATSYYKEPSFLGYEKYSVPFVTFFLVGAANTILP